MVCCNTEATVPQTVQNFSRSLSSCPHLLQYKCIPDSEEFDEAIGELSLRIKDSVFALARVDWRTSVPIHKKMNQGIEDLLWDFCDEYGIDLQMEQMDILIENTIKTAMSRY